MVLLGGPAAAEQGEGEAGGRAGGVTQQRERPAHPIQRAPVM